MKIKKNTILLSGFFMISSLVILTILQFTFHHVFNKYINSNNFKNYIIVISGGIFTSSFIVFIVSIREYFDERENALRGLARYLNYIIDKYKKINFFVDKIPEDIAVDYFFRKESEYIEELEKTYDEINKLEETFKGKYIDISENSFSKQYLDMINKEKEKNSVFRECVWNNESEIKKMLLESNGEKEEYLDKRCLEIENEYSKRIEKFIKSLQFFYDYDVYNIQEQLDKLCFFYHKKYKMYIESKLIPILVNNINLIKYHLNKIFLEDEERYINELFAMKSINETLLLIDDDRNNAYIKDAYELECVEKFIKNVIRRKKVNEIDVNINKYNVCSGMLSRLYDDNLLDFIEP